MSSGQPRQCSVARAHHATGRAINKLVVRAPGLWPLLRRPVRRFFDRAATTWDERTGAGSPTHLAPLAAALLHVSPAPERALEIGAGTGQGVLLIAREFPRARVRGIDIAPEMVRVARRRVGLDPEGRVAFRVGDAASLPYGEDSFDLIAHLNMPPFFAEIARVLKPGGHVVVASSWGPRTPFFTPVDDLRRGFVPYAIEIVTTGEAGEGTFAVGRLSG